MKPLSAWHSILSPHNCIHKLLKCCSSFDQYDVLVVRTVHCVHCVYCSAFQPHCWCLVLRCQHSALKKSQNVHVFAVTSNCVNKLYLVFSFVPKNKIHYVK